MGTYIHFALKRTIPGTKFKKLAQLFKFFSSCGPVIESAYRIHRQIGFSQSKLNNTTLIDVTNNLINQPGTLLGLVIFGVISPDMICLEQQGSKFIPRNFVIYIIGFLAKPVFLGHFIVKMR